VAITPLAATTTLSVAALSFPTTPQQANSASQRVTLRNTGNLALVVAGLDFAGPDPDDFFVGSDTCRGPVAPGESCDIGVRFSPQASDGTRGATLRIRSNSLAGPGEVQLSGAAAPLPRGATGQAGVAGPTGATGPAGAAGAAGAAATEAGQALPTARATCKLTGRRSIACAITLVGADSARITAVRLSRAGRTYAKADVRGNPATLRLRALRPLRKGRYSLDVGIVDGVRKSTIRTAVSVR
jgi:hypothetical protein